mgnify:CR=1 FL=1
MYTILVASLNENMKLAKVLQQHLSELNQKSEIVNLVELELPMYDSLKEEQNGIPTIIQELNQKMIRASGYIVVAPEYKYSIPPVLTNVIAWISRSSDDFREVFTNKFVQLATHSGGGGSDVMNAIRSQLNKLGSVVVPREIITTYQKPLDKDGSKRIIEQFVTFTN